MSDGPTQSNEHGAQTGEPQPQTQPQQGDGAPPSWGCSPSLEDLYRYMDGVMEPERQSMVRQHMGDCPGCDDFLHFHTGLQKLIGSKCQSELPEDLSDRVFRAITDHPLR